MSKKEKEELKNLLFYNNGRNEEDGLITLCLRVFTGNEQHKKHARILELLEKI